MRLLPIRPIALLLTFTALVACDPGESTPLGLSALADASGSSSTNSSGSSSTRIRLFAQLVRPAGATFGSAVGKAKWDSRYSNTKRELEIEVEHLPAGLVVEFFVDGVRVGTRTTNFYGHAEIEFETEHGESVPESVSGLAIEVRSAAGAVIVAGRFATE